MVAFAFLEPSSSIRAASSEAELRFIAVGLTLSPRPCGTRARKPRLLPVVGFAVPGGTPDELPRH
jgi:hypothetical protein